MPVKIRLTTVKFASLCVLAVMVLSVCVQPVNVTVFMDNEKVREQIEKSKGPLSVKVNVNFTPPAEAIWLTPEAITLSSANPSATVELSSNSSFDTGSIIWKLNGVKLQEGGNSFTLNFGTLIATLPVGVYNLIVEGTKGGAAYSSPPITVNIGNPYL